MRRASLVVLALLVLLTGCDQLTGPKPKPTHCINGERAWLTVDSSSHGVEYVTAHICPGQ